MRKASLAVFGAGLIAVIAAVAARRVGLSLNFPGAGEPRLRPLDPKLRAWIDGIAGEISPDRLYANVVALPAPRNRLHAPEAMQQADEMILEGFRDAGWTAERRPFTFTNAVGYVDHGDSLADFMEPVVYPRLDGANIVATREGESSRAAIVVLGHSDTVRDTPGANDNTAAVAALLELARVLAPYHFRHTVILAATDMEELDLFGAKALVPELLQERRILGAINYETMAYTSPEPNTQFVPPGLGTLYRQQVQRIHDREARGDFTTVIYNGPATELAASFAAGLAHLVAPHAPLLLRDPNDLPLIGGLLSRAVPVVRNFSRGDHVPFWREGIPAIQITDTANFRYTHYHQPTDTPEKLDYDRLAAIVGATAVAIAEGAGLLIAATEEPARWAQEAGRE